MKELENVALKLLYPIWLGIPKAYRVRYSRNIWQQFENNIRSAAYTSSLSKFYNAICLKLGIDIPKSLLKDANFVLSGGNDREILRLLRNETSTLVIIVRLENDKRKADLKEKFDWKKDEEEWIHEKSSI